jgi:hypothetical protein
VAEHDGASTQRLTDAELWRGVEFTVRNVLLPAIDDEWARAAAIQLVGVARYATRRPADDTAAQVAEVAEALAQLAHNPLVTQPADHSPHALMSAAGRALAAAVNDDGPHGDEVRTVLRPVLLRQLDAEFDITGPLVNAFRGNLDD